MEIAERFWTNGKPLRAGRIIFERIPSELRPNWAARIFKLVLDHSHHQLPLFHDVLSMANNQHLWGNGHNIFSDVRTITMKMDKIQLERGFTDDEVEFASIVALAELVCKVTYNATHPLDEFDEDSGWYIAVLLKGIAVRVWADEKFSRDAWDALSKPVEA
ncbi:hypothetical protein [Schlesneria paludicola]|uniref:hypothetical protein n=1 Tax=Schlesneria paludicola TaxID=360056 RepID=UPI00029B2071|nr:hypothetical protein [Schlesneria paludicola]